MWMLWLIWALLLIIAMALLIRPLFKLYSDSDMADNQKKGNQRKALNIALYEQKKNQIEQDFANGLLDEEGRTQAQNETEHSLIHDAEGSISSELTQLSNANAKKMAISLFLFIPAFSVITYYFVMPENFAQVLSAKKMPQTHTAGQQNQVPDIATMVTSLENKLKEKPENAQGWNMLGRSYVVLKRYADAASAYEKALTLVKQGKVEQEMPELEINYVEALMQIGEKDSYQEAENVLNSMLNNNPNNGDALWFMGFLDYNAGKSELAIERWTHLLTLLPPAGEQANIVNTYLRQIKGESQASSTPDKADTTSETVAETISETTPETTSAAAKGPAPGQQLTGSEEENAFIASMVGRVEKRVKENPNDLKGWKSLGKSYSVLNRHIDSANAYAKAVALDNKDVDLLMAYSDAIMKTRQPEQLNNARIIFAQLVDQNPNNLDALFLSGSLARVAGDKKEARLFWEMLLPQLEPGSVAYKNVEKNINSL